MVEQEHRQQGELPGVPATSIPTPVAPGVPTAALSLATAPPHAAVVQEAIGTLMNTSLSPFQMASQFATIKERYLATTYGIIIE